jgi:hypothetical protein
MVIITFQKVENVIMEVRAIDLKGQIPNGASIEFIRAEVAIGQYRSPFALVRYALQGVEQDLGLRLDMDKEAFIDHFDDDELESAIQNAAPKIADVVGAALYPQ